MIADAILQRSQWGHNIERKLGLEEQAEISFYEATVQLIIWAIEIIQDISNW